MRHLIVRVPVGYRGTDIIYDHRYICGRHIAEGDTTTPDLRTMPDCDGCLAVLEAWTPRKQSDEGEQS